MRSPGRKPIPRIPLTAAFLDAVHRSSLTRTVQARRSRFPQANQLGRIVVERRAPATALFARRLERLASIVGYVGPIFDEAR